MRFVGCGIEIEARGLDLEVKPEQKAEDKLITRPILANLAEPIYLSTSLEITTTYQIIDTQDTTIVQ